ncbi:hypothetical protein [Rahnella perminowiae]|uniref:hypothetical protein n=1 Tax=Rahnella perminowiae TaxID=2816244 RepID=UPI001C27CF46|nr:hypothetical protein [Rahnella perminowiae]MBU9823905.1 hypothetical protein [Rahnella perminowiae]
MNSAQRIWPEGDQFTKPVTLQTNTGPLEVEITYTVPPFEVVVEFWQNKNPEKSYPLFRQFLVDWDMQDKLTDNVLITFLMAYSGTSEAIFEAWATHMTHYIVANNQVYSQASAAIN